MRSKRIFTILLVVALTIISGVIGVSAAEDNANSFQMAVEITSSTAVMEEPCTLKPGDSIEVSVMITENTGLKGVFGLDINYDADALELASKEDGTVDYTSDKLLGAGIWESVLSSKAGKVTYRATGLDSTIKPTGKLVTIKFIVKSTFDGTAKITLSGYDYNVVFADGEYGSKGNTVIVKDADTKDYNGATIVSHKFDEGKVEAADCTKEGTITYTCTVDGCGYKAVKKIADKTEHTPGAEATCTTAQTCTVCSVELAPAKGHTPGAEATCTTAQTCTVCNAELAPAKGHTPGAKATCTTAQTCTVCNVELASALGHKAEKIPAVEPTYKEEGSTEGEKCSVCGEILKAPETIEKKSSAWIWITVICAVVVIGGGAAAFVVLNKKKKAQ